MKACAECKYDIDMIGTNQCDIDDHVFHGIEIDDMCCNCGKAWEYLWK